MGGCNIVSVFFLHSFYGIKVNWKKLLTPQVIQQRCMCGMCIAYPLSVYNIELNGDVNSRSYWNKKCIRCMHLYTSGFLFQLLAKYTYTSL